MFSIKQKSIFAGVTKIQNTLISKIPLKIGVLSLYSFISYLKKNIEWIKQE